VVEGLEAIELRSPDPGRLSRRWSEILGRPVDDRGRIALDQGAIGFRETSAGEVEGLAAIELQAADRDRIGVRFALGGVECRLI
jgi:hypothetical protein